MRRLLATWLLLCAALYGAALCLPARSQMIGEGIWKTPGASCAGFTIDGAATSQPTISGSTTTQTITTTHANEVIFSIVTVNAQQVTSTSDTAGVFSATAPRKGLAGAFAETAALSTGTLSGDTITTTYTGTPAFVETIVFGVVGAHVASPFDSGGSSNVPASAGGSPVSVTTNNANTLILGFFRNGANGGSLASGWTGILNGTAGFTLVEYKAFSSAQTGLSVTDPSGSANDGIGDALVCGP